MTSTINKALIAIASALAILAIAAQDGITGQEWLYVGLGAFQAIGVYAVPYAWPTPPTRPPGPSV